MRGETFFDGLPFHGLVLQNVNVPRLTSFLIENRYSRSGKAIHFVSAHAFAEAKKDVELRQRLENEFLVCDGRPLTLYLKMKDRNFVQTRGSSFMRNVLSNSELELSHYFLGSSQHVLDKIILKAKKINPNIRIVGSKSPTFTNQWKDIYAESLADIQASHADVVWVGLGAPKQFFVASELARSSSSIFLSVGAAFDFFAGTEREAPELISKFGLEWLYRFVHNPRRLFKRYVVGNLIFIGMLISDFIKKP